MYRMIDGYMRQWTERALSETDDFSGNGYLPSDVSQGLNHTDEPMLYEENFNPDSWENKPFT